MNERSLCHTDGFSPELLQQCFGVSDPFQIAVEAPCLQAAECLLRSPRRPGPHDLWPSQVYDGPQFKMPRDQQPTRREHKGLGHFSWKTYKLLDRLKKGAYSMLALANFGFQGRWRLTAQGNYALSGSHVARLMWRRTWFAPGSKQLAKLAIGQTFMKQLKWVQLISVPLIYGGDYAWSLYDGDVVDQELARRAFVKEVPKAVLGSLLTIGASALALSLSSVVVAPLLASLAAGIVVGMAFDWAWDRWVDPDSRAIEQVTSAVKGTGQPALMVP